MTRAWIALIVLPLVAAACVPTGGSRANTASEIEQTVDGVDLDGDGSVEQGGVEVGQVN